MLLLGCCRVVHVASDRFTKFLVFDCFSCCFKLFHVVFVGVKSFGRFSKFVVCLWVDTILSIVSSAYILQNLEVKKTQLLTVV